MNVRLGCLVPAAVATARHEVRTQIMNGMLVGSVTNDQSDQVYGRIQAFDLGSAHVPTYLGVFRR